MTKDDFNRKTAFVADSDQLTCWVGALLTGVCGLPAALALAALFSVFAPATAAHAGTSTNIDLSDLPLEQLLKMDVTILKGHDTLSKPPA